MTGFRILTRSCIQKVTEHVSGVGTVIYRQGALRRIEERRRTLVGNNTSNSVQGSQDPKRELTGFDHNNRVMY